MNRYHTYERQQESRDRLKSGLITAAIWSALLVFLFIYKVVERLPEKKEVETRMLINFGDNRNGNGLEEPANQEGSQAAEAQASTDVTETAVEQPQKEVAAQPAPAKVTPTEKIITGTDAKKSVKTAEESSKTTPKTAKPATEKTSTGTSKAAASAAKTSGGKAQTANSKTGNGDGKGNAAIGNLLKGRGTKAGSQGTGGTAGNAGDPLGGDGNGDSKVGIDRRLTGYIPGTMGRGGSQPSHNCSASGTISISYTVDKAGNVISARRSSGISDPCVVSTSISWVKRYVKAEKASTNSTGTYKITF